MNDPDCKLETLNAGINFRIIQGKQSNSRVIVQNNFCYILDKTTTIYDDQVVYVKCKYSTCPARGIIKEDMLEVRKDHTCHSNNGHSLSRIAVQEVLSKMKRRAATEGTSFFVSFNKFLSIPLIDIEDVKNLFNTSQDLTHM